MSVSPETLAAAAARRMSALPTQKTTAQLDAERRQRINFQRLIDPGIVRPNAKDQAMRSMKTLLTLSENLLRDPENEKFKKFKPTNSIIKRDLMDAKGALEYAIEMGFRPHVEDFQPYYVWSSRHLTELQTGTEILKSYLGLELEKESRAAQARADEKAVAAAAAERVRLAFMDDRQTKQRLDEIEREHRLAKAAAGGSGGGGGGTHLRSTSRNINNDDGEVSIGIMPGPGHTLPGGVVRNNNNNNSSSGLPADGEAYDNNNDNDDEDEDNGGGEEVAPRRTGANPQRQGAHSSMPTTGGYRLGDGMPITSGMHEAPVTDPDVGMLGPDDEVDAAGGGLDVDHAMGVSIDTPPPYSDLNVRQRRGLAAAAAAARGRNEGGDGV